MLTGIEQWVTFYLNNPVTEKCSYHSVDHTFIQGLHVYTTFIVCIQICILNLFIWLFSYNI